MSRFTTLLHRLHEQSTWHILVSYGIGSWIILQVTETVSSLIGLPLWMGQAVLFTLLLGLPMVLVTALVRALPEPTNLEDAAWRSRLFTWRNVVLGGVIAFAVLAVGTTGYLGMRSAGIGSVGTLIAKGVVEDAGRVVLADVENATSDPALAQAMTEILRVDLEQSSALTLAAPAAVRATLRRMGLAADAELTEERAREVAMRDGVPAVISASVTQAGGGVLLSARLVAASDGATLAAIRETAASQDEFISAVDRLSAQLRERIGESLRSIRADAPLADVSTTSMDALRAYAQAEAANNNGQPDRAISLLEEALQDDSLFAMAHRKLAIILSNQSREPERARAAFTAAYDLRDRLTDRESYLAQAAYHEHVQEDVQASIDAYTTLLEAYPTDWIALNNLGVNYGKMGRQEDAERTYRSAIALGNPGALTLINALDVQFSLGLTDRADSTLALLSGLYPEHPRVPSLRARHASANFRWDEAERLAREAHEDGVGHPAARAAAAFELAAVVGVRGRLTEALTLVLEGYDLQAERNLGFIAQPRPVFEPILRAGVDALFYGNAQRGADRLTEMRLGTGYDTLSPEQRDDDVVATVYAEASRVEELRSLIESREAVEAPRADRSPELLAADGWLAMVEERHGDAAALFSAAHEASCTLCFLGELAEAHRRAGETEAAIAAWEGYLDAKVSFRVQSDMFGLWSVLRGLAEAYEQNGNTSGALEMHRRFIELWRDADPELQPYVDESRAAVARLEG